MACDPSSLSNPHEARVAHLSWDAVVDFEPSSYLSLEFDALGMYSIVFDIGNVCPADLTGDNQVDVADLLVMLGAFASFCP